MIFELNQISNRDTCLLYIYRILRQPSDLLKAIYTDSEPKICQIQTGTASDSTYKGELLYEYTLDVVLSDDKIPYLEFECENENVLRNLVDFIYYDTDTKALYAVTPALSEPVTVKIYEVHSIHAISDTLSLFREALRSLYEHINEIRKKISTMNPQAAIITGTDDSLVEFYKSDTDTEMSMRDTGYHITGALISQRLVNPTQELLSRLTRVLKGNIIIDITDGLHRVLDGFTGNTIFISGNGSWVFRDITSTINIYSSTDTSVLRFYNCNMVYFRHIKDLTPDTSSIKVASVNIYHTVAVGVQGVLNDLSLSNNSVYVSITDEVRQLSYVGVGCTFAAINNHPQFDMKNILGNMHLHQYAAAQNEELIIMNGRTVGFNFNQHDFELPPLRIQPYDIGYIHITEGPDDMIIK